MRASAVRTAISDAIEAITPDTRAGEGHMFRRMSRQPRDPEAAPERAFRLVLVAQPQRDDLTTWDSWRVEYQLSIYYPHSPDVEDVIGADAELIDVTLEQLQTVTADLHNVVVEPSSVSESAQLIASRFSVVAQYRQDAAVIAVPVRTS